MSRFLNLMEDWEGYTPVGAAPPSSQAIQEAMSLITNVNRMPPHRHRYLLQEAIVSTDFPDLFGFILERDIVARYKSARTDWRTYCPVGRMPNFNVGEVHKVQGNDTVLDAVAEKGEYLIAPMVDAHYHRQVGKYGRQFDISWEATINDVLGAMTDMPARFADACVNTESRAVTALYAAAAGPNGALFGAPIADVDGQNVTNQGVLPLTIANLETTLELMAAQTDVNGTPLGILGVHLVVPVPLQMTARAILTSALVQWTEVGAGGGIPVPTVNVIPQMGMQLHVDPWLQVVDASGTNDTTWYLFADKSQGRAMQMDYLTGWELPEICLKASGKVTTAGAPISPFAGDFATDNVIYRVRHVHGGTQLDPRYAYAQVGP